MLRARICGERWVLVEAREAWVQEQGHAEVAASQARTFAAAADTGSLSRMLRVEPHRATALELGRVLADRLRWGSLRLLREVRELPKVDPAARIEPLEPYLPAPLDDLPPVVDGLPSVKRKLELTVLDYEEGGPLAHLVLHVDHRDDRFEQLETDVTGTVRSLNLPPSHRVSILSVHDPQSRP